MSPENNTIVIVPEDAPQVPVAIDDSATLLAVISRAASDPSVDVDKLERLMAMHERFEGKKASVAYAEALALMQPKLPKIPRLGAIKNNSGAVQSRYAKWEHVNELIRPCLAEHDFSLTFRIDCIDKIKVTGVLTHKAGHFEETTITLPADTSGSKNAVQAVASSVSYGKRYTAGALLNLTSFDEDDDGVGAIATLTDKQINLLLDLWAAWEPDANKAAQFYEWAGCKSIEELPPRLFDNAVSALEKRIKQKGAK